MSVLGMDMMGEDMDGDEMDGDELSGDAVLGMALVGAAARRRQAAAGGQHPKKPRWRNDLAPGVPTPGYGVFPIPLTPQAAGGDAGRTFLETKQPEAGRLLEVYRA